MSKYTTEVRYICETEAGYTESQGYKKIEEILTESAPKIFDFNFPIFDESYRLPLEIKILRHYYTREICEETRGLWQLRLSERMNLIMPYYNKLYTSELLDFNPFYDVDLTRTTVKENEGNEVTSNSSNVNVNATDTKVKDETRSAESSANSENISAQDSTSSDSGSSESTNWDLYSDTPQGGVVGINNATDSIASNAYLTNARKMTGEDEYSNERESSAESVQSGSSNQESSSESNVNEIGNNVTEKNENSDGVKALTSTEDYIEQVSGKQGTVSYSKMLEEFRKTFLNIDKMIINELSDLFFGLW